MIMYNIMHHKKGLNVYVFLKHHTVSDTVVKLEDIIIKKYNN